MMKLIHRTLSTALSTALVMLIGFSGVSSTALAVAPSDSPLSITVTVTHSEDTEGKTADRVYFEVNLSPSPLMLMVEPPSQSRLEGEEIIYTYTAVSTANGPDSYTLSVQSQSLTNVDGSIGSFVVTPNTLTLGATAASGSVAAGTLEIPVLSDGDADNSINGIEAGDLVFIHGQAHTVDVVEDQPLEETSVIHLTEAHDSTINVGDMISEAKTFELAINGVDILDKAQDALVGMTVTGASDTDAAAVAMHDTQTIVYAPIPASTEYWVRNVTNPNGEGDAGYATADQSYYGTGGQVKASAGDELEYIIVQSAGNTGDLNDVVIRSTMPLFTTYIGNSTHLNGEVQADASEDPAQSLLIAGIDIGLIVRNGQANVTFRVTIPESDQGGQNQGQQRKPQGQGQGQLQTVTFDPPPIPSGAAMRTNYQEGNVLFTGSFSHGGTQNEGRASNSSTGILEMLSGSTLRIEMADSSLFTLKSVDLAEYSTVFADQTKTVTFIGYTEDGSGLPMQSFTTDGLIDSIGGIDDFETFNFPAHYSETAAFGGLKYVLVNTNGFAMDNLTVQSVP